MRRINPRGIPIFGLLIAGSIISIFYIPGGLMSYVKPIFYWTLVAIAVIYLSGGIHRAISPRNGKIITMAFLVAVFQIFISLDAGLVTKFGKSPVSFTVINMILNFLMVSTNLIGIEFARAYILKNIKKRSSLIYLVLITFFFTFIDTSFTALFSFKDKVLFTEYLGETFLPFLADHLLSTYVVLIGGPLASLAYRAPNQLFQWFSPILPDLTWGYKSIIGVMVPTIGYTVISASTSRRDFFRAGLKAPRTRFERKNDNSVTWITVLSVISIIAIWSSTGLFGFQPNIVGSGSMEPVLQVGDITVTVDIDPRKITEGDIIQFRRGTEKIIHRVVNIYTADDVQYFITKGDANRVDDDPITGNQITGQLVLTIPKIGWASIYVKTIITILWKQITYNALTQALSVGASLTVVSIYSVFKIKNHPLKRLKFRGL